MPPLDNSKGMRVTTLVERRPVEGKVLWFPMGIVTRASDVDDEDILEICTNLRKQGGSLQ